MKEAEIEKMRNDLKPPFWQCHLNRKCFYSTLSTIWNKAELESVKWEAVSIWGISR